MPAAHRARNCACALAPLDDCLRSKALFLAAVADYLAHMCFFQPLGTVSFVEWDKVNPFFVIEDPHGVEDQCLMFQF